MQKIQRIYCTHCTYKTSLIERSSSQSDNAVFGYSVRSSSIDEKKTDEIRKVFRAVERLLSYDLPQDTTSERKAQLSAASAPRKMVFQSKLGDNQAVGVISYRTKDTAGRTGSYFADIIVNNLPRNSSGYQQPWTPLAAIQCWPFSYDGSANSNWWCESEEMINSQAPDSTPLPTPAPDLTKLRGDTQAFLNDQLLWAFLTEKTISNSVDKGRIISPRWSNIPVEQRQDLFIRVLQALIDISKSNKPRIVLAVEPSVASLIYYGIFRLLPKKFDSLSPGFSFTTYVSRPERTPYTLTATTFDQAENKQTDLKTELYSEGFCCNTFGQERGFKYSKTYGDSFTTGAYTKKLHQLIQSQDKVNFYKFTDSLLECLRPLPNIGSQDLDEAAVLYQEMKTYLVEGLPLLPSSKLLNRSLSGRENILAKSCTCFFLTNHTPKHAPSVDFCVNLINWSGVLSADSGTSKDLREKIFSFVPKTSASLRSLLEAISPLRLPEDVLFNIVVPITVHDKKIPSGFVRWVKETPKQSDQGKYAEKLLGLLDEDTRSSASLNALDKFPELLFSVLERESFYRGPNAAKIKYILVECLCTHLKKDNPWQLLLAFPKLTAVIQLIEPGGLNAIRKTLSDSFTRAEKLQSPPPYLDIQSQCDSRRSLQNLQNWVKLTDNKPSKGLIRRYENLTRKFDEIVEIEDQSFIYKMLSPRVKKSQLREITKLIEELNNSGPPSKTGQPYLKLLEKQFRATGKNIKAFERAENAIEKYKNRVPAKLASPRKKAPRNLSFFFVSLAAAILVVLSLGTLLYLSGTTQFNEPIGTEPKTLVAANNTPNRQHTNVNSSSEQDLELGSSATVSPIGGGTRTEGQTQKTQKQQSNSGKDSSPMNHPTGQDKSSGQSQLKDPTPDNTTINKIILVENLFKLKKTYIDTTDSGDPLTANIVLNDQIDEKTRESLKDQLCILLLDENQQEQEYVDYKGQKRLTFQRAEAGKSWSIAYSLKTNRNDYFLIEKLFVPAIPKEVSVQYLPDSKKLLFMTAAQKMEEPATRLGFDPPFNIQIKNGKNEIHKSLLLSQKFKTTVDATRLNPSQLDSLKIQLTPEGLPGPSRPVSFVYIPGELKNIPLTASKDEKKTELAEVPSENVAIDLFLFSPSPEENKLLSLTQEKNKSFYCYYDDKRIGAFEFSDNEQWSRKLSWAYDKENTDEVGRAVLLASKLLIKPIKTQFGRNTDLPLLEKLFFNPYSESQEPMPWDPTNNDPIPANSYKKPLEKFAHFFRKNLKASIGLQVKSAELVHKTTPPVQESFTGKRALTRLTFGTRKQEDLVEIYLFYNAANNVIEFNSLNWSQSLQNDVKSYAKNWHLSTYNENVKVPKNLQFTSKLLQGEKKEIWAQIQNRYKRSPLDNLNKALELNDYLGEIQAAYDLENGGEEELYKKDVAYQKLYSIIERLKEGQKLKEYFDEGILVTEFDLFWDVEPRGDSEPEWATKYYADNPQQRIYWSRFKGQENNAAAK